MAEQAEIALFDGCRFVFVATKSLPAPLAEQYRKSIEDYGGEVLEADAKGKLPIPHATHVISNTIDFPEFTEAEALMVPVVTVEWVKTSILRTRQAQVRPFSPDPRMIFSSVVLTCADLPLNDKEAIIGATMALGGVESKDVSKTTTHICALSLDHPKCQTAIDRKLKCKIVLPHWFDDCFKLGKRIDETPYLLPDPEILRARPEDELDVPSSAHMEGATSAIPDHPLAEEETGRSGRPKLTVFAKRKVLLSWDLPINSRLRKILHDLICDGGGEIVVDTNECDMFIGQFRDGPEYVRAAQSGKDVGNLAWLYHLIVHNEWTSPFRRLLHYPVPRNGIPGFENMRITLSNYGGEARIYLENLIKACGATFTKTMKADNTHLITARKNGEKCEAALDWNIHTINHLWIEESYAKCEVQSLTIPKYTHWPSRTNLGEVIGQTFLDEQKLHETYYPGGDADLDATARRRRQLLDAAHENALVVGAPTPKAGKTPKAVKVMRESSPTSNAPCPTQKARAYETPARGRHIRTGKENDTPSILSSGSRSAKAQALSKLQNLAPDIALYEKEKKRSAKDGHAPWGGKRAADQIDKERSAKSSSPAHQRPESDDDEETRRPAKKQKPSAPTVQLRLTLTGYKRWVGDKKREDADRRKLRELGVQIVNENATCDYLVAPKMVRTLKFLKVLARGVDILKSEFVDDMLEQGEVPDPEAYHLQDKEAEKRFGVTLRAAIARAKKNKASGRPLLWNVPIYCTADIKNGVDSYKALAEANGAIFKVYRARSGTTIKPTTREEDGGAPPEPVYLLTSNSPAEKELWPRFEAMARKGNMEPRVVVSDWMLDVILRQEYVFDKKYLVTAYFPETA
ncbi:BRCT domain-containing protein [Coniochaeta hoffmannii]|uniref:BRCT domain-containing protein n=1 Tax=Coniochaeta hoffmannii TaxID=91930 RepID=A0AA38R747_9PEZI|nr:BRCT domain-containing protein [Coniochaeta hoffmannii]